MWQVMRAGLAVMSQNQRKSGTTKGTGDASFFFQWMLPLLSSGCFFQGCFLFFPQCIPLLHPRGSHGTVQRLEIKSSLGGETPQVALEIQPLVYKLNSNSWKCRGLGSTWQTIKDSCCACCSLHKGTEPKG